MSPKKISNNNIKPSSSNSSSAVASPSMSSQKENILAEKKDALQYVSPMNKSSINSSPIIVNNSNTSNTRQAPPLKNMSPFSPRKRREAVSSTPGQSSGSIQKPSPMSMKLDLKLIQPSSVLPSPSRQQQQQSGEEVGGRDDTAMEEEASAPSR